MTNMKVPARLEYTGDIAKNRRMRSAANSAMMRFFIENPGPHTSDADVIDALTPSGEYSTRHLVTAFNGFKANWLSWTKQAEVFAGDKFQHHPHYQATRQDIEKA